MYVMFADEADAEQGRGQKFFIYGAVFIEQSKIKPLHDDIEAARAKAKYKSTDSLKFADSSRPKDVSKDDHRTLKSEVVEAAKKHGVVFCAYAILHELARNAKHADLVTWGANTILGKFNEFLGVAGNEHGLVMFDRIPIDHPYRYLSEKFQVGMTFKDGKSIRLERILGYASTCDGASHLSSVADVLVGAFRYCVNEPDRKIAGAAMFPGLVNLMWKREKDGKTYVLDVGLVLRPKVVKEERLQKEYNELLDRLQEYENSGKPKEPPNEAARAV